MRQLRSLLAVLDFLKADGVDDRLLGPLSDILLYSTHAVARRGHAKNVNDPKYTVLYARAAATVTASTNHPP